VGLRRGLLGVVVAGVLGACASPHADDAAVRAALTSFSRDFNNRDLAATCGLYADDAVVNFPGRPPLGRTEACDRFRTAFADPGKVLEYAEPEIREVLVDGDLATVALIWTLTVKDKQGRLLETARENGLDVLRRQPGGQWRIHISHAFPVEDG